MPATEPAVASPGLVDELELHIVPLVLGGGARLFDGFGPNLTLEQVGLSRRPE